MADISKINNYSIKDATARANHSALVEEINQLVDSINEELDNKLSLSGGTLTGPLTTKDLTLKGIEQFQTHYAKKLIGTLSAGTSYANLDSKYKDGTYHRMWRLRFPASCNFWGKIKITLYGGYSSFNASGIMSKSITCNFNGSSIYNNVGFYDGLGVNVEKDFRISEAIWNSTASAWEILIWQKNLNGNNSPTILIEAWSSSETHLTNAKNITAQAVELTQATTYTASKASSTGGTKTVTWATTPVYETPLGEEIATMSDIPSVPSVSVTQKIKSGVEIGSVTVGSTTTKLYAPEGSTGSNDEFVHIKVSSVNNYGTSGMKYIYVQVISGELRQGDLIQVCHPKKTKKYNLVNGIKTNERKVNRMKAFKTYTVRALPDCVNAGVSMYKIEIDTVGGSNKEWRGIISSFTPDGKQRKPRTVRVMRPYVDGKGFTRNKQISNSVQITTNSGNDNISVI